MPHIQSKPYKTPSSFRKIAATAWPHPNAGQIFAEIHIPIDKTIAALNTFNKTSSGPKATINHAISYVIAKAFEAHPLLNRYLSWKGFRTRNSIDIFLTTLLKGTHPDLSGIQLPNANQLSFHQLVQSASEKQKQLRLGKDKPVKRVQTILRHIPTPIARPLIFLLHFLFYTLNIPGHKLGLPEDRFGSVIITPLGPFQLERAAVPLFPYSKTPYLIAIGTPKKEWHEHHPNGETKLPLFVTADHRIIDGYEGAKFLKTVRSLMAHPETWLVCDKIETV